jgi:hypothetical protein
VLGNQVTSIGMGEVEHMNWRGGDWFFGGVWQFFQTLGMVALALLLVLFVPQHLRRTADTAVARPLESGGIGLLSFVLLPFVLIVTLLTCVLPPLIVLFVAAASVFGWVSLGMELGQRLSGALNQTWSYTVEAVVGTLALGIATALLGWIPCIGWLAGLLLGSVGLGATILSRFGTQPVGGVVVVDTAKAKLAAGKPKRKTKK